MRLSGRVRLGKKTKWLSKEIKEGEIALINHRDIDQLAAQSLIEARVRGVINASQSISGKYPNLGPEKLLAAGIPLIDNLGEEIFEILKDGDMIDILDGRILKDGRLVGEGEFLSKDNVEERLKKTRENLGKELDKFVDNTLDYAKKREGFDSWC